MRKFVVLPDGSNSDNLGSCEVVIVDWIGEVALAEGKKIEDLSSKQTQKISIQALLDFYLEYKEDDGV